MTGEKRTQLDQIESVFQHRVVSAVLVERFKQDAQWGVNFLLNKDTFVRILGEEFGEVCKAVDGEGPQRVFEECVQVAAVAIRMGIGALLCAEQSVCLSCEQRFCLKDETTCVECGKFQLPWKGGDDEVPF